MQAVTMSQIRKQTIQGLTVGATFTVSRKFTEQDMMSFADITRDYNPIHFDERFVAAKKLSENGFLSSSDKVVLFVTGSGLTTPNEW